MRFFDDCWNTLTHALAFVTFNPWDNHASSQHPLTLSPTGQNVKGTPVFAPPNGPQRGTFQCEYPSMKGWKSCSTSQDRGCWLRGPDGDEYNIHTNYEEEAPTGILRKYELDVDSMTLAPDGFKNLDGKVFNQSFPGPWIQACWGDTIEVKVRNHLKYNGTAIHWHGIRQLGSLEMDGVNGVTQCPIAPGDEFTYRFKATQYGTSWYHSTHHNFNLGHSHYSLQYADGLKGPLTIYGPSSAPYDQAIDPILMSDWNHRSAFSDFYKELNVNNSGRPLMTSLILNDSGQYTCTDLEITNDNCTTKPPMYTQTIKKGKKYLLRLINTSVDNTFIFAVDNHNLTVVGADFVPIKPYITDSVLIGIGQRYHVILDANLDDDRPEEERNYWIRTVVAKGCNGFSESHMPDERTGILRYSGSKEIDPTTNRANFLIDCSDEPYENLIPIVPWYVGEPVNEQQAGTFQVGLTDMDPQNKTYPGHGNFSRWDMGSAPMFLNFTDPTILNLNKSKVWPANYGVVGASGPAVKNDSWVYLLVTATGFPFGAPRRRFLPAAHPIHLHGHDFAILQQSNKPYWDPLVNITRNNPPRRDVALLPANGFLILAFKADNPGSWLMHCHIAWHASSGLALQILEREKSIVISPESEKETRRVCKNWDTWFADVGNYWNAHEFQEDSGI